MEARHIKVHLVKGGPVEYQAAADRILRAILGKWGELRIFQVEILEDVNIETKKQLERVVTVDTHATGVWRRYTNIGMAAITHG